MGETPTLEQLTRQLLYATSEHYWATRADDSPDPQVSPEIAQRVLDAQAEYANHLVLTEGMDPEVAEKLALSKFFELQGHVEQEGHVEQGSEFSAIFSGQGLVATHE
jgi:hypothetical protein